MHADLLLGDLVSPVQQLPFDDITQEADQASRFAKGRAVDDPLREQPAGVLFPSGDFCKTISKGCNICLRWCADAMAGGKCGISLSRFKGSKKGSRFDAQQRRPPSL
jgi:hypothetical protein